jgi:O-antigen/teichoic acid export membrane protein
MSRGRAILLGAGQQWIGQILGNVVSVFTLAVTIRYLGQAGYGQLTTAVVFVALFEVFTDFGVGVIVLRRATAAGSTGSLRRQVDLSLGLGLAYSLPLAVIAGGVGGGVYWGQTAEQVGIAVLALGLPFTTIATCYTPVFQYHLRFGALALGEVASRVLNLLLVLVIAHFDLGLYALCASQAALPLLRTAIYVIAARRYDRFRPAFAWPEWRALIIEAAPIGVTVLVAIAYLRLSGLLLSLLRTPEEVGAYGVAFRISTMLTALSQVFGNTVFPALSKTWNSDRSRFTSAVQRCSDAMVVLGAPLVVLGVPLAGPVIHLLANGEIRGAVLPLQLLLVAAAVFFVNSTWSQVLIVAGEERFLVRLLLVELAFHLVLSLILIPRYGTSGACAAFLATEVVGLLGALTRVRHITGFRMSLRFTLRLAPALLVGLAVALATPSVPSLLRIALVGGSYVLITVVVGPLRPGQLRQLMGRVPDDADDPTAPARTAG